MEEKIKLIEESEQNTANKTAQIERELAEAKKLIVQLENERKDLEWQVAEMSNPPSRLSQLSEESEDFNITNDRQSNTSAKSRGAKKAQSRRQSLASVNEQIEERPTSRSCVIL